MAPLRKRQKLSDGGVAIPSAIVADTEASVESKPAKADRPRRSIFVKGLAPETTTEELTELFSENFPLKHATAVVDPVTQQCRGYGFVTFADAEDAQRAKEELKDHTLHGRKIRIDIAEPRQRQEKGNSTVVKKPEEPKGDAAPRLIVRNLPWSIKTSEQLETYFKPYGAVKSVILPKKPGSGGMLRGFGIVIMKKHKTAQKAIEELSGREVDGRTLAIDWAVDKSTWQNLQHTEETEADSAAEEEASDARSDDDQDDDEDDPEEALDDTLADHAEVAESSAANSEEDSDGDDGDEDDTEPPMTTLFIRNLPFSATDETLENHFARFGSVRYARIVIDQNLGIPKGTGFVCFYNEEDAQKCLKAAPKEQEASQKSRPGASFSVLQNVDSDLSGNYTMDGRVLQVSQAVSHKDAKRLKTEGESKRRSRDSDKRRLFLLSEGTISTNSPLYKKLSPTEIAMRESSVKQRKKMLQSNPSLNLSLTRLAVRNLPRSIDSSKLKALAREAVVGFASDVKNGTRSTLSKEELARGGEDMKQAEQDRKRKSKGLVKQAKVVFESKEGGKVDEKSGAGRSRGYGFIEYHTHRNALMGLRWLNGHEVGYKAADPQTQSNKPVVQERKKRLIVEFAIENAQVVHRRKEREAKHRGDVDAKDDSAPNETPQTTKDKKGRRKDLKRKREEKAEPESKKKSDKAVTGNVRMIAKNRSAKRHARKMQRAGA